MLDIVVATRLLEDYISLENFLEPHNITPEEVVIILHRLGYLDENTLEAQIPTDARME